MLTKIAITIILMLYVVIIGIWFFRFPISYKLTNGSYHDLVVDHDFTEKEREGLDKAYQIRQTISNVLIFSSILVSASCYISVCTKWFKPTTILKIVMFISGFIAILLTPVNGIHFIPGPPIR